MNKIKNTWKGTKSILTFFNFKLRARLINHCEAWTYKNNNTQKD